MGDTKIIDAIERYIRGEMNPDERLYFENLRKTNPEIDQQVVEHTLFLQQMNRFGEWKKFRSVLNEVHTDLAEHGKINYSRLTGKARVVYLWKRYKRVAAIAAIIAGVTTLTFTAMVNVFSPKADSEKLTELSREFQNYKAQSRTQANEINKIKTGLNNSKSVINDFKSGGTAFLIDGKGYLVTNAHIIRNSSRIVVVNNKNEEFSVTLVKIYAEKDIAILRIDDENYKPVSSLPYAIRRSPSDVAEPLYTLGYPRNDIVYTEGYLSARTGLNGDTLSCQLGIAANHGNSGGPVFNHEGEVIGVISTKETQSEGVAFAIQSKYIFDAVDELKKDSSYQSIRIPVKSSVHGMDVRQQVKKIQDFVFLVKAN